MNFNEMLKKYKVLAIEKASDLDISLYFLLQSSPNIEILYNEGKNLLEFHKEFRTGGINDSENIDVAIWYLISASDLIEDMFES